MFDAPRHITAKVKTGRDGMAVEVTAETSIIEEKRLVVLMKRALEVVGKAEQEVVCMTEEAVLNEYRTFI